LLHSTTSLGTPLDRASPSTSPLEFMRPREWPHAFATRGGRNAFAISPSISRLGSPEIAPD
jgi:hypothetical protein